MKFHLGFFHSSIGMQLQQTYTQYFLIWFWRSRKISRRMSLVFCVSQMFCGEKNTATYFPHSQICQNLIRYVRYKTPCSMESLFLTRTADPVTVGRRFCKFRMIWNRRSIPDFKRGRDLRKCAFGGIKNVSSVFFKFSCAVSTHKLEPPLEFPP